MKKGLCNSVQNTFGNDNFFYHFILAYREALYRRGILTGPAPGRLLPCLFIGGAFGLPDMDGVEVIRQIRSWSNMPVIVISARSDDADKIEALAANTGKVLTHTFITQNIRSRSRDSDVASLRVFMTTLRKKIEPEADSPKYIQTHVGIGYRMLKVD